VNYQLATIVSDITNSLINRHNVTILSLLFVYEMTETG